MTEWEQNKKMSKEFAVDALKAIKQFYNRLYYFEEKKPFNSKEEFESAIAIIDGLKEFVSDED